MTRSCVFVVAVLALGLGKTASAQGEQGGHTHWWMELDPSWYAGAGLGQSSFDKWLDVIDDGSLGSRNADDRDTGMRFFAGVSFGRYLAVELGYADFGEGSFRAQSDGSGSVWSAGPVAQVVEVEGVDLALLGKLPLTGDWALFGKAGLVSWDVGVGIAGDTQCCGPVAFKADDAGTDLSYGGGVQYDGLGPLRLVAEYGVVRFSSENVIEDAEVDSLGISIAYRF